jgi:uncharacterized protein YwqG
MNLREVQRILTESAAPAIQLVASPGSKGQSRLGGTPALPPDLEWPTWQGTPLNFLGQIDLSELPQPAPLAALPASGIVYFFYDQEQSTWGFDPNDRGSWCVLYSRQAPDAEPTPLPAGLDPDLVLIEQPVGFRAIETIADPQRFNLEEALDEDTWWELEEWLQEYRDNLYGDHPRHQIGGFPRPEQNDDMELEAQLASSGIDCGKGDFYQRPDIARHKQASDQWQLLLQLDSDDELGAMWGDCGMLYFWIRKEDLANEDFSKVWMTLQCG